MNSGELIYIVMRQKGIRSDGYYYESETEIIGLRRDREKAGSLLKAVTNRHYGNDRPIHGAYDKDGDTEIVYDLGGDLEDRFWIEKSYLF